MSSDNYMLHLIKLNLLSGLKCFIIKKELSLKTITLRNVTLN